MMKVVFGNLENEDINKVVKHISNNIFRIGSVYSKIIARKGKQAYGESLFEFLVDDSFRESKYHSSKYYQMDVFIPVTHLQFTKNVIAVTDLVADYLNYDVREETAFGFIKEHLKSLSQLGDNVCPVSIKLKSDCETKEVLNLIFKI